MKYTFSNKYLKDNSKPGSYRRGYETFQNGMVEEVKFNENIVRAKIKGNFKSFYETGIKFTKGEARFFISITKEDKISFQFWL